MPFCDFIEEFDGFSEDVHNWAHKNVNSARIVQRVALQKCGTQWLVDTCKHCGRDLVAKRLTEAVAEKVQGRANSVVGKLPKGWIICPNPNCGYQGLPEKRARGSTLGLILLLLFCLVPGILYLLFKSGYNYFCPKCGTQVRSDWEIGATRHDTRQRHDHAESGQPPQCPFIKNCSGF